MAKNFVQNGNTISVSNTGKDEVKSGDPVVVGARVAVAITDIPAGATGDGFATGVFLLTKLAADDIAVGTPVFIKAGNIQLDKTDAVPAGVAWENAGTGDTVVEVKINA
jgi:predicted RecA/RadA family phage recombinase